MHIYCRHVHVLAYTEHIHTHTDAYKHTCIQAHTHMIYANTRTHTHTCIHTLQHTHIHTYIHMHTHTDRHIQALELPSGERWSHSRAQDCQFEGMVVQSHLPSFRNIHTHICLCLSEETLKAGGPFYLVSMPGEVKDPTQGVNV